MPGLQLVQEQTGAVVLGIDVRDVHQAAADFVRDRGVTFDSIFDPPGRTLARLSGYPRNAVPSTLVLDEQHRVAAVFLLQIRVSDLIPLVQRLQPNRPCPDRSARLVILAGSLDRRAASSARISTTSL